MQKELIRQYEKIKDTILSNHKAIGRLIDQAEMLDRLIDSMDEGQLRSDLKTHLEGILAAVSDLMDQTYNLFQDYNKFAKQLL
jgi:ABC-type transporter Mla subunit MlaD